jgi:hypothetical protein
LIIFTTLEVAESAAMVEYIMPVGCTKSLYGSMRTIAVFAVVELGADMVVDAWYAIFWLIGGEPLQMGPGELF